MAGRLDLGIVDDVCAARGLCDTRQPESRCACCQCPPHAHRRRRVAQSRSEHRRPCHRRVTKFSHHPYLPLRLATATVLRLREPRLAVVVGGVVFLSLCYAALLQLMYLPARSLSGWAFPTSLTQLALATGIAWWQRDLRYTAIWRPLAMLVRGAAAILLVQVAFDALYPSSLFSNLFIGIDTDVRTVIGFALATGVAAMWRPSFVLPMLLAYIVFRNRFPVEYALPINQLDFRTLADVGAFPVMALLVWRIAARSASGPRLHAEVLASDDASLRFQKLLWALSIGIHLGNYFHSGLAKLIVGGGEPLFWVFHNPTVQAFALGMFRWNTPLGGWPDLAAAYAGFLTMWMVPINLFVLLIQLAAPLAVSSRRTMAAFTLAFDAMHIGIYASLGALFFFWIALNLLILFSLTRVRADEFTAAVKITCLVTALLGYLSFSTAGLGWLDGAKTVRQIYVAETADGTRMIVPQALFGLASYQLGHGELWVPPGHYKMRRGGNVRDRGEWADATGCGPAVIADAQLPKQSLASVTRLIGVVDAFHRAHPWIHDSGLTYLYPHHLPPNPAYFERFDATPMAAITGYTYVVQSGCPRIADGVLEDDIRIQTAYRLEAIP